LKQRLWRQRVILGVQTSVEILSFIVAATAALWMRHQPLSHRLGTLLLGWLLLQTFIVVRLRLRGRATDTASVLQGLEARIEQDAYFLRSLRSGSVTSMLALAGIVLATATAFLQRSQQWSPALQLAMALLAVYVFATQAAILVWMRRIQRSRARLEEIRKAMSAPE
jgi:hypothetical protein